MVARSTESQSCIAYRFPPQEHEIPSGAGHATPPPTASQPGEVVRRRRRRRHRSTSTRGHAARATSRASLIPYQLHLDRRCSASLVRLAEWVLAARHRRTGPHPAPRAILLRRRPPRVAAGARRSTPSDPATSRRASPRRSWRSARTSARHPGSAGIRQDLHRRADDRRPRRGRTQGRRHREQPQGDRQPAERCAAAAPRRRRPFASVQKPRDRRRADPCAIARARRTNDDVAARSPLARSTSSAARLAVVARRNRGVGRRAVRRRGRPDVARQRAGDRPAAREPRAARRPAAARPAAPGHAPAGRGALGARAPARRRADDPPDDGPVPRRTWRMHPDICASRPRCSTRAGSSRAPDSSARRSTAGAAHAAPACATCPSTHDGNAERLAGGGATPSPSSSRALRRAGDLDGRAGRARDSIGWTTS